MSRSTSSLFVVLLGSAPALQACGSDSSGNAPVNTAGTGGSAVTAGGSSSGGSSSVVSGGTNAAAGTTSGATDGGSTNTGGSTGTAETGGSTAAGGTGSGSNAPAGYSSWIGFQAPDEVVAEGSTVPVAASDCPEDPDMASGLVVFANSMEGSADALSFDWTHNFGGWHAAVVGPPSGTLSVPLTDPNAQLVFWIKGSAGGEEGMFLLRLNYGDGTTSTELWPPEVPGPVTTAWTKLTIPVASFSGGVDNASGVLSLGTGNSHSAGHAAYLIDNVYFTTGE